MHDALHDALHDAMHDTMHDALHNALHYGGNAPHRVVEGVRIGHAGLARCRGRRRHGPVSREVEVLRAVADVDVARVHVMAQVLVHLADEVVETLRGRHGERRRLADGRCGVAGGFEHRRQ